MGSWRLQKTFTALAILILTTLATITAASRQRTPDYAETFQKAEHIARMAINPSMQTELHASSPLLFSSVLFHHELMKLADGFKTLEDLVGKLRLANVSHQCSSDTAEFVVGLTDRESWAVKIIDTIGKPPPDLEGLNLVWPGAYKECLDLNKRSFLTPPTSNVSVAPFNPQYCTAGITLQPGNAANPLGAIINMGICVPDSCSEMDLNILINMVLYELNVTLPMPVNAVCQVADPPLDTLAIAAWAVVGFFVLLMIIGTVVDVVHTQLPKWRAEKMSNYIANSPSDVFNHHDDIILLGNLPSAVPEPKLGWKLLMAFSVYTNGAKLLSTDQASGTLGCVHGIRFLSMSWVVLGHTYLFPLGAAGNLIGFFSEATGQFAFQTITNATVSVDSFFVLSGLLVCYLSLKELKRSGGKMNWFKFYLHRFWRLTPPYMLIIFLYTSLGRYLGSGPQWLPDMGDRENCRTTWWTNLLYINNFVKDDKVCLGQSWYLANDMQFFILSPLIFIPLYKHPLVGAVSVCIFLCVTTVVPAALTMTEHFTPGFLVQVDVNATTSFMGNFQTDYYIKPYNRMGAYIMGMLAGYFLYRTDCKIRINKWLNLAGWVVAAGVALVVLYGLWPYHLQQDLVKIPLPLSAFYNSCSRTAWGAAVSWVIFACVTGNGGFVNTILSWKGLVPLSRLTYVIYLLHIWMLGAYLFSRDTVFYMTHVNVVVLFLAVLVACYMVSAIVSMAFEAPMLALEKLILKRVESRGTSNKNQAD